MSNRKPIMVVVPNFGGSSEVWLYRQVTGLSKCKPLVLCENRFNEHLYPAEGVKLTVLPPSGRSTSTSRLIRGAKAMVYSARNISDWNFRDHPRVARSIHSFVESNSPKATLFHFGTAFTRFYPAIRRFRLPVVVHYNGYDISSALRNARYRREMSKLLSLVDAHVVVADYMKEALVDLKVQEEKIKLIPYGVPCHDCRVSNFTKERECRFLMVGRLTAKKAPQISIRAFAACTRLSDNCTLEIIGDGELRAECEAVVNEEKIQHLVKFSGARPNSYVREAMSRSSVFLQHSLTSADGDKEGWPVAIAEASASGLPVVSTRHAGIVDQIVSGDTGFLVEENDLEGMAHYMNLLACSADLRVQQGNDGRRYISQWDVNVQIGKLDDLLYSV